MTTAEWHVIAELLDNGWKGEFDTQEAAYRHFLAGYEFADVEAALQRLVRNGKPWLPAVAEIVAAIEDPEAAPAWSEAYRHIHAALASGLPEHRAIAEIEQRAGPVPAAFVEAEGYDRLRAMPVDDPDWGWRSREQLERRYREFADVARERQRDGRALVAAGRRGGLTAPDYAGALPSATAGQDAAA